MKQVEARMVTAADFQRLRIGMTHGRLLETLGAAGEEAYRDRVDGKITVLYQWENPDGSWINAIIQDNRLISMTQGGLG